MLFLVWLGIPVVIFVFGSGITALADYTVEKNTWWGGPLYFALALPAIAIAVMAVLLLVALPFVSA